MGAVKIIVNFLDALDNADTVKALSRKMSPPLVTLLSAEPEIQYIALRNINLIVQKQPSILSGEIRVFFCRYNDPIYVKMEKLELMVLLCIERNTEQVLLELKEYATEVDVDFVRKSVRAIGRIAIKLERSAEKCINVLLELIKTRVNYVVQESIIVIKDIFRRYPNRYESIIATLCDNLENLDEPEAKASMVWIVGEYASRIDNADDILETFLDSFTDETSEVQLQLLTATVKLYLKRPESSKELMESVLSLATEHSDNPDLRDRGYIYWRLLSSDPEAAKRIVLADKPVIGDDSANLDASLLEELIQNISTLSSIYHKPSEAFVKVSYTARDADDSGSDLGDSSDNDSDDDSSYSDEGGGSSKKSGGGGNNIEDLLDFGGDSAPAASNRNGGGVDLLGSMDMGMDLMDSGGHGALLLDNNGLRIEGAVSSRGGGSQAVLDLRVSNNSPAVMQDFKVQFNKNAFGLMPQNVGLNLTAPLAPGGSASASVPLRVDVTKIVPSNLGVVDVALKVLATGAVEYFKVVLDFVALLSSSGKAEKKKFIADWQALGAEGDVKSQASTVRGIFSNNVDAVSAKLAQSSIFNIAARTVKDKQVAYYSCQPAGAAPVLLELTLKEGFDVCKINLRSNQPAMLPTALQAIEALMQA